MILKVILIILVILVLAFVILMIRDSNRFVIREYYFCVSRMRKNAKVIVLADLHNKVYGDDNRSLLRAIDRQRPDFILIAGDMLTAVRGNDFGPAIGLLRALSEKYPVYYGNGNHECRLRLYPQQYGRMSEDFEEALSGVPLERLLNRHISLPELNIDLYGLDMDRIYYKRFGKYTMPADYLYQTLGSPDPERVTILIAHNPEYFKAYAAWGADMVVSGHVHGGIVRLPLLGGVISPRLRLFPKYDGGIFTEEKATMFLSRGLGGHTIPVRLFNPGEVVVIHLRH